MPLVVGDEIDRWEGDLQDEGDPLDLLENRIAEYGFLGKMFIPSSPTIEEGAIWRAWLESDQRVFMCPCPKCGVSQQWLRLEDGPAEGELPEDCLLLTAGVDYQKTWVEVWVWGWTRQMRRWPIARVQVPRRNKDGTLRSAVAIADDLKSEALDKVWSHALGGGLRVEMAIHDSGDHPSLVFDVLEHLAEKRNFASKGVQGWNENAPARRPKIVDVKQDGKVVATGRQLMLVHTASAKAELYEDLRRKREDADGERFVHMPPWMGEPGHLEGLVAEEVRLNSRKKPYWHKVFERNEPLDCAVLARVAHWQLKAHRWAEAEWKAREIMVIAPGDRAAPSAPVQHAGPGGRRVRGHVRCPTGSSSRMRRRPSGTCRCSTP
ncbi:terminase gpA endonuclease subunit [uncultured Brevundimonas sp.]|uniref:terminase gpA endonuclease subunit n=1 Tax=uncultured Brevundimonas sp. TaxID=213418 RepID=UPI0025F46203|nr:terminase gpA endonuclease subunit [uncultured Brevundimonas sp.]